MGFLLQKRATILTHIVAKAASFLQQNPAVPRERLKKSGSSEAKEFQEEGSRSGREVGLRISEVNLLITTKRPWMNPG